MSSFSTVVHCFKEVKALVIGDIMLDRFMYGKVERISPEAPVPVFRYKNEKVMLGGAGNVVANLTALGCQVRFLGVVGQDNTALQVQELLAETGAKAHLLKLKNYPTTVKTRLIANNNHLTRIDMEDPLPISDSVLPRIKKILSQIIQGVDIVLLSDYNKGIFTTKTTQMIIKLCRAFKKPVIVDPKGANYEKYAGATLVKPNLKEFGEATGRKYENHPKTVDFYREFHQGAKYLFKKYKIQNVLITLSEHGMAFVSGKDPDALIQIPTVAKEVFDVSGAGDTSMAALGAALGAGLSVKDAMQIANMASGIVVGKLGTATVSADELRKAFYDTEKSSETEIPNRKIITLKEAKIIIDNLKKQGKVIGFTNGCFDCCHLGHLHSFIEAKKHCDILVVGVNSDASVKRYKGPTRPLQDERTRSLLLASMEFIDYVIVFDDDTALPLVDELRPDVLAKEGYTLDKWPEGRFVQSYGGRAVTLPRLVGYSTTGLVEKMKG